MTHILLDKQIHINTSPTILPIRLSLEFGWGGEGNSDRHSRLFNLVLNSGYFNLPMIKYRVY